MAGKKKSSLGALGQWLTIGCALWWTPAGQTDVAAFWSAVDLAQARNPKIHRSEADLRAAVETRPQRAAKLLPSASLQAAKTVEDETRYRYLGTTSSNEATMAKVTVNQPLLNVSNYLSFEQGHEIIESSRAELDAMRQEIALQVTTAAANWLQAKEVLELAESYKQVTQRHLDITRLRFHAGESTETDAQQSESRAAQARSSHAEARNTVDQTRATYRELVGEDPDPRLTLPDLSWDDENELALQQQSGFIARPDVQAVQARLRENGLGVEIRRAEFLPTVDLTFQSSRTWDMEQGGSSGRSFKDQVDNHSLMVIMNLPLFNSGETLSRVRQSIALKEGVQADYEWIRQQALREAQQAKADMIHHRASMDSLTAALAASNKALAGLEEEFLVGTRTLLDLLDAQYEVFTIQTNRVRHRYQEQLARIRLWKAVGRSLQPDSAALQARVVSREDRAARAGYPADHLPPGKTLPKGFPEITDGPFLVQVATLGQPELATPLEEALMAAGIPYWRDVANVPDGSHLHRILVGPFAEYQMILTAREILEQRLGIKTGWIPNPAWQKGLTSSYWREERSLQHQRIGQSFGYATMN